ncbi:MAG TPA: DUF4124 domain-containing protein [Myxococcota bacterium]|nr:DUF4124 domain-containing protein [Myxococcota bacterium]
MRRVTLPLALALTWTLCGPSPLARAQIYRWEDAQGHLHYSSEPPPAGAKSLGTLDTSQSKGQDEAPRPQADARAAEQDQASAEEGAESQEPVEPQVLALEGSSLRVEVSVPPSCTRRKSNGGDARVLALYDCGQRNGRSEGMLAIVSSRETHMTRNDVQNACRAQSQLLQVTTAVLRDTVTVKEASCDAERRQFVLSGTYRKRPDLPEAQVTFVPTTDGLIAAVAMWQRSSRPSTVGILRAASQSLSVPDDHIVWPSDEKGGGSFFEELAKSMNEAQQKDAAHAQGPDVETPMAWVFLLLGAAGLFKLYRILSSDELGARMRKTR